MSSGRHFSEICGTNDTRLANSHAHNKSASDQDGTRSSRPNHNSHSNNPQQAELPQRPEGTDAVTAQVGDPSSRETDGSSDQSLVEPFGCPQEAETESGTNEW
jgi:hypothetical protein